MARRITRKSLKHDEFVETAVDAGQWIEENWQKVAMAAAGVVVVILLGVGWTAWRAHRAEAAEKVFGEAFDLYTGRADTDGGAPRWDEALERFEEAERKASAPLDRVAEFYRGVTLLRRGDFAASGEILERVAGGAANPVLAGSAKATLADALAGAGDIDGAEAVLRDLAASETAVFPPEVALLELARLQEAHGRAGEARTTLREIVEKFAATPSATEARTRLRELEG